MRPSSSEPPERSHGSHTLEVREGVIVGIDRDDVFVELGPRMQGVISARDFGSEVPAVGETHEFTMRGREEGLWVLALPEAKPLLRWEEMEVGLWTPVRIVRAREGGLAGKIGGLHAFLPRSQAGLARGEPSDLLTGKTLTCEVVHVDPERQRVTVSRKAVLQRERESHSKRETSGLSPGQVVQGRVSRVADFGAFVRFGNGLEGMVHVSDLAWERVGHPDEVLAVGDRVEVKVLRVRREGKRISLGLKQMQESPFVDFERVHHPGDIVEGEIKRLMPFGAFVRVAPGVEGLLHRAEMPYPKADPLAKYLHRGDTLSVRVLSVDSELARLSLSLLHTSGMPIAAEEAEGRANMVGDDSVGEEHGGARLGHWLAEAGVRPAGEEPDERGPERNPGQAPGHEPSSDTSRSSQR